MLIGMRQSLASSPVVQALFAAASSDFTTLSTLSSMPSGGSISRSGNAMVYDATGKLTYAPNNLLLNTATLSTQSVTTAAINYILSFKGTGSVALSGAYSGSLAGTGASTRVSLAFTSTAASLTLTVTGTITEAQLEAVTYQTTPSTYVATTSAAYYGPRFDYDPATLQPKGLLVEGARTNLLTYSEAFDNAAWTKTRASISANAVLSPDGTTTADKLVEDTTASNTHQISASVTVTGGTVYTYSIFAKPAGRNFIAIQPYGDSNYAYFNLSTGAVGTVGGSATATITNVGNGWYRCSIAATAPSSGALGAIIYCANADNSASYTGDGASGVYLWGAQAEAASFQSSYISTSASTVSRAAETFSLANYTNRLVEAFWLDQQTGVANSFPETVVSSGSVTISPPTFGWVTSLRAYTNAYAGDIAVPSWLDNSGTTGNRMVYDSTGTLTWAPSNMLLNSATLSTQTVTVTSGATNILSFTGTGSITYSGAASGTLTGTGANNRVSVVLTMTTASLTLTVSGSVTQAQLEPVTYQTQPRAYIATTTAAVYQPRFDYSPSTLSPLGLLIEESRANLCTYSEQFNTSWTRNNTTITSDAITAPDGTMTADKMVEGSGTVTPYIYQFIGSGGTYTASVYAKAGERNWLMLSYYGRENWFNLSTGAVGSTAANVTSSITSVGNGWYRCAITTTAANVGSPFVIAVRNANSGQSYTGDGTSGLFVWGAQLEAGAWASSYIPNNSSASSVTRVADVVRLTGSALTTLQGSSVSMITEAVSYAAGYKYILSARNSSTGLFADFYTMSASISQVLVGSVIQASFTYSPAPTLTNNYRVALAIQANNFAAVANNGTLQTDNSGSVPTGINEAYLGRYLDGFSVNGHVRSLALYNVRLPDAILKQKSAVGAAY